MNIDTNEYEQKRHVFDLCRWINDKMAEMYSLPDFDTIYLEREKRNRNVKKLIEEAIPISCLGLQFFSPWNNVYVKCLTGNQKYDAELEVKGFLQLELKIEATTIETDESTMRRQALSRKGFVHFTGPVRRDGRDILSEPKMIDLNKENDRWVNLAFERYLKKVNKGYDADTGILISLDTYRPVPLEYRAKLAKMTQQHILREKPNIYGAYYCYLREYVVDGVYNRWR